MVRSAVLPPSLRYKPFRGTEAVAAGLLTARQLDGPAWRRLFRDVYICAEATVDHLTLCQAAALLLPAGAALSHRSAAMLYAANILARDQPVEVAASTGLRSQSGLRVVRSHLVPAEVWRRGGLPVTSPLRTAFDLARTPDLTAAVVGLDALLFRRIVTVDAVRGYLASRYRWAGTRVAARALDLARVDVESPMETRLRLAIVLAGLPEPIVQYDVLTRVVSSSRGSTSRIPGSGSGWSTTATTTANGVRSGRTRYASTDYACSTGPCCGSPQTTYFTIRTECLPRSGRSSTCDALSTLWPTHNVDKASQVAGDDQAGLVGEHYRLGSVA